MSGAHHWQKVNERHDFRAPRGAKDAPAGLTLKQLVRLKFIRDENEYIQDPEKFEEEYDELFSEQHATAAQIYFLIKWQLKYSTDPLVNLSYANTSDGGRVGPVERYKEIEKFYEEIKKLPGSPPPGPWVPRDFAKGLKTHFRVFLNDLRR